MKKFIFRIVLLFSIIAFCDFTFGKIMDYVINHIQVGGQGRDNYICNQAREDMLVFGSSRAVHHYNAQMLEDSLGISCFNCGDDSNGIILSYGRLKMMKGRYTPQLIIQDVEVQYDLLKNDNHTYLGWLKARYEREGIADIFNAVDHTEKYKMVSQMYRYNTKFLQNIFVFLTSLSTDTGIKGFRPLNAAFDPMKVNKNLKSEAYEFDSLKLSFINKFIDLSEGSQLYFVVSPTWYGTDSAQYVPLKHICQQRNIPLIDFSNDQKYVHNDVYFKDGLHLNAKGADEFTRDLIAELKRRAVLN